jgi:hypothetical protein
MIIVGCDYPVLHTESTRREMLYLDGKKRSSDVHSAAMISGKYTKFDVPGCIQSSATKTNDHHTIVGFCQTATTTQGFYVTY